MNLAHGSTLILLALILTACGGGSEDSAGNQTAVSKLPMQGQVVIEERSGRYYIDAWFSPASEQSNATGELLHEADGDRCERTNDESQQTANEAARVSAGSHVSISSRTGIWAEIERQDGLDLPVYASETRSIREAWPDDALLEVEGDVYPSIPATALSPLLPLQVLAPTGSRNIPRDGELLWEASPDERDHIDLVLRVESAAGSSQKRHTVHCRLTDDGAFTIPATVLASADWIVRAARTRITEVNVDDAVMRISQISER